MNIINLKTPEVLKANGSLHLHTQQGVNIQIDCYDDDGDPIDMRGRQVFLEINDENRIPLTHGDEDHQLKLTIVQGSLNDFVNKVPKFVVLDETDAAHELIWEGQLQIRGWV